MNINSVNNANIFKTNEARADQDRIRSGGKHRASETSHKSDSLEISSEAVTLGAVKQKIEEGFYDRPDVIRQVAYKINQDLKS